MNDILETLVEARLREIEKNKVFKPIIGEMETRAEEYRQELISGMSDDVVEKLDYYAETLDQRRAKECNLYYITGFKDALQLIRGN